MANKKKEKKAKSTKASNVHFGHGITAGNAHRFTPSQLEEAGYGKKDSE